MKAVVFTRHGGPETLEVRDIPTPNPGAGEVRVAVEAAGFNYRDILLREGQYSATIAEGQPFGIEAVGHIDAVGEGVDAGRVGERVALWNSRDGGYAESFVGPADQAWPIADGVAAGTALGALAQGLTAEFLIRRAEPKAGSWALVHAAAGGVGPWLVHLLKARGVRVVGAASSEEKREAAKAQGADLAIEPTPEAIAALAEPVDRIYHTIGALFDAGLEKLAPLGAVLVYGAADGIVPELPAAKVGALWGGSRSLMTLSIYDILRAEPDGGRGAFDALLADGFQPEVARYPLERAADAHRDVAARKTQGKVVLEI